MQVDYGISVEETDDQDDLHRAANPEATEANQWFDTFLARVLTQEPPFDHSSDFASRASIEGLLLADKPNASHTVQIFVQSAPHIAALSQKLRDAHSADFRMNAQLYANQIVAADLIPPAPNKAVFGLVNAHAG